MEQWTKEIISEKYNLYGKMLYRLCVVYLRNKQDAEDAVQDTFYQLMCHPKKFTDSVHEKRWLICVAKNICKNMLKKKHMQDVSYDDSLLTADFNDSDIEIMSSVNSLKEKYRDVIILFYFENYSVEEISGLLGVNVSAVKMRLKRARDILKVELEA